jgi:antitoxin Phd
MQQVTATEIKNRLGQFLARVAVEPVTIEKNGRPVAVLLAYEEYEALQRSDDHFWGEAVRAAEAEGFLSAEDSLGYVQRGLADQDRAAS